MYSVFNNIADLFKICATDEHNVFRIFIASHYDLHLNDTDKNFCSGSSDIIAAIGAIGRNGNTISAGTMPWWLLRPRKQWTWSIVP